MSNHPPMPPDILTRLARDLVLSAYIALAGSYLVWLVPIHHAGATVFSDRFQLLLLFPLPVLSAFFALALKAYPNPARSYRHPRRWLELLLLAAPLLYGARMMSAKFFQYGPTSIERITSVALALLLIASALIVLTAQNARRPTI